MDTQFAEPSLIDLKKSIRDGKIEPRKVSNRVQGVERVFFVLRGLPGANKSGYAQSILEKAVGCGVTSLAVLSTEDYFVEVDGTYVYNSKRLNEYHRRNLERALDYFKLGTQVVVLDNCNVKHNHYRSYAAIARIFGYEVIVQVIGKLSPTEEELQALAEKSIHRVSLTTIRKYASEFEP